MQKILLNNDKNLFVNLMTIIIIIFILIALSFYFLLIYTGLGAYKLIISVMTALALLVGIYLLVLAWLINRLLNNKNIHPIFLQLVHKSIRVMYPIMISLAKAIKIEKNSIRRVFSQVNNKIVKLNGIKVKPEELLIITPHCLQQVKCKHKVTGSIYNCKKCGACDISDLIDLCDKYKVTFEVVTGGTLARKTIKDYKPKGIIAVACERDLIHGMLDVEHIPVLGITNKRPEGPCKNTLVDIDEVEKAIKTFIGR